MRTISIKCFICNSCCNVETYVSQGTRDFWLSHKGLQVWQALLPCFSATSPTTALSKYQHLSTGKHINLLQAPQNKLALPRQRAAEDTTVAQPGLLSGMDQFMGNSLPAHPQSTDCYQNRLVCSDLRKSQDTRRSRPFMKKRSGGHAGLASKDFTNALQLFSLSKPPTRVHPDLNACRCATHH